MAEPTIRPATDADLRRYYDRTLTVSVRAWVAELDGKVLAVAGVQMPADGPVVYFSDMQPAMHAYRKAIVRGARTMLQAVGNRRGVAIADCDLQTAARTLAHFGFMPASHGVWTIGVE